MELGKFINAPGLWAIFLLLSVAASAHAQLVDSPRAAGMGGANRGDPVANSALIYNPAGMSRSYQYAAQAQYFRSGDLNVVGANVVDSKTQPALAVGVAYGYQFTDSGVKGNDGHDARVGFSRAIIPGNVNVGVSLRYLYIERAEEGAEDLKGFTLDAGLLFSSDRFHLGISGQSLINLDDTAVPRKFGGGVAYTGDVITADFDAVAVFDAKNEAKMSYAGGLEIFLQEVIPIRLGYEYVSATESSWAGGGIGFVNGDGNNAGQVSISFRQNIEDAGQYLFAAGMTLFL